MPDPLSLIGTSCARFINSSEKMAVNYSRRCEGRVMLRHPFIIAAVAASFAMLPARIPLAGEIHQPGVAPAISPESHYNEVLPYWALQRVLGKEILSSTGEHFGRVVDVLVDQGGQIRGAVIDFGGFLGVGSRRVVVDWAALRFASADHEDRPTRSERLPHTRPAGA
jgi:sporulation protein YlmC with PRC-barrel domain